MNKTINQRELDWIKVKNNNTYILNPWTNKWMLYKLGEGLYEDKVGGKFIDDENSDIYKSIINLINNPDTPLSEFEPTNKNVKVKYDDKNVVSINGKIFKKRHELKAKRRHK